MALAARTLGDYLLRAAASETTGLRVLARGGEPTWMAWPTVVERAMRVCGGLQASGVQRGDRIALIYPTTPEFFDAFFGVVLAGAVPVPLYPPVRLGRLEEYHRRTAQMLDAVSATLVLADRRIRRLLGKAVVAAAPRLGCRTLSDLPACAGQLVSVSPDDLGLVQFSSGTTRDPKPVALSHRAVAGHAAALNTFWPDADGEAHSGVSWLPLYHDMGLIGCVFAALERPGTLTLLPPEVFVSRPAAWLQAISAYRATLSPAPNFAYALCVDRIRDEELKGVDLSSWRIALNGAETAVPDVMRAFARRFAKWGFRESALTPVYGLSEASLAVTFSEVARGFVSRRFDREALAHGVARESDEGREIASVGRAVPGVAVRVVDAQGQRLGEGEVGNVECSSPFVMTGYLGQPDATARALRDGWLKTGDLGFLWDGNLFLTGRAKDMLLLRGRNYAPDDVERAVDEVPGVRTGCAVAVTWLPEGAEGERLLVLVEARRDVPRSLFAGMARACTSAILSRAGLAADRVIVLEPGTLPRTSSGKLRRQDALREFLAGSLAPPRPVTPLRMAAAVTRSSLAFLGTRWRRP